MNEMIKLKRKISELKQELQEYKKKLPYYNLFVNILEDELESRKVVFT